MQILKGKDRWNIGLNSWDRLFCTVSESAGAEKFFQFRFVKLAEIPCFEHAEFNAGDLRSFQTGDLQAEMFAHFPDLPVFALMDLKFQNGSFLFFHKRQDLTRRGFTRIDLHSLAQGLENVIAHLGTDGNTICFYNMMRRMHKPVGKRAVIR